MKTRDRITEAALSLFAENGFNGTSVKQIADAVGIKDASLYKHFKSKQEIFESIVLLIQRHMSDLSGKLQIPTEEELENDADVLTQMDITLLKQISRDAFIFYFSDSYVSRFWKIAHMEQYVNEEIYGMFRRLFIEDAIEYLTRLMVFLSKKEVIKISDPKVTAIAYYAPIFLLLTKYVNQPEKKEEALELLDHQVEEFYRIYKK